jgi:hypothetical protein
VHREIQNLYFSPSVIRAIKTRKCRQIKHTTHTIKMRNAYNISDAEAEGITRLRTATCIWHVSIKLYLTEAEY